MHPQDENRIELCMANETEGFLFSLPQCLWRPGESGRVRGGPR
jgi:hypothetical protein